MRENVRRRRSGYAIRVGYFAYQSDDGSRVEGPIPAQMVRRLARAFRHTYPESERVFIVFDGLDNSHYVVHRRAFPRCSVRFLEPTSALPTNCGFDMVYATEAAADRAEQNDTLFEVSDEVDIMKIPGELAGSSWPSPCSGPRLADVESDRDETVHHAVEKAC